MQIKIIDTCVKCGVCNQINSKIFHIYSDGAVVNEFAELNADDCYDAILNCPVNAIIFA